MKNLFNNFTALAGLVMGIFIIYVSYMMTEDLPDKKSLLWLKSAEISDVSLKGNNSNGRITLYENGEYCLSINSESDGFSHLFDAIKNGNSYSVGYNPERELFSDDPTLYNVIYEIRINDEAIKSYETHVKLQRFLFAFIAAVGLTMLFSAFYIYKYQPFAVANMICPNCGIKTKSFWTFNHRPLKLEDHRTFGIVLILGCVFSYFFVTKNRDMFIGFIIGLVGVVWIKKAFLRYKCINCNEIYLADEIDKS